MSWNPNATETTVMPTLYLNSEYIATLDKQAKFIDKEKQELEVLENQLNGFLSIRTTNSQELFDRRYVNVAMLEKIHSSIQNSYSYFVHATRGFKNLDLHIEPVLSKFKKLTLVGEELLAHCAEYSRRAITETEFEDCKRKNWTGCPPLQFYQNCINNVLYNNPTSRT